MKLVLNGTQEFEVNRKPTLVGDPISFSLEVLSPNDIPSEITGDLVLKDTVVWPRGGVVEEGEDVEPLLEGELEEDFVIFSTPVSNWLRYYVDRNVLYCTNIPIPLSVPEPTDEESREMLAESVREQRDTFLAETDWTQLLDAPIDDVSREEVRVYRQALRDVPQQENFPEEVMWPEKPDIIKGKSDPVDTALTTLVGGE